MSANNTAALRAAALLCLLVLNACGGSSSPPPPPAPAALNYTTPDTFLSGQKITPLAAGAASGNNGVSFSVTPALPAGLSLDAATGVINGTPSAAAARATYTVTVTNSGGSNSQAIDITVVDATHFSLNGSTGNGPYLGGGNYGTQAPAGTPVSLFRIW